MGLEAENTDAPARLIAAGRAMLARGEASFPLTRLCAEAGVSLDEFRQSFASKAALMEALGQPEQPASIAPPSDPWLERRLRVFERALKTLEERSESDRRAHVLALARMEETLAGLAEPREAEPAKPDTPANTDAPRIETAEPAQDIAAPAEPLTKEPDPRVLAPFDPGPAARLDAEALERARRIARPLILRRKRRRHALSRRALVVTNLVLVILMACAVLTYCFASRGAAAAGLAHRSLDAAPLARLLARADSGDARAEFALAYAYPHGEGVARDEHAAVRWSQAAALRGDADAQYLLAGLARDGVGMARDPATAFRWFSQAAMAGQGRAMHSLAIAYVEGIGTARDETAAAAWFSRAARQGSIDSAFNLGVLYERGMGVEQNVETALAWYAVAARAGDAQAAVRARRLATEAQPAS